MKVKSESEVTQLCPTCCDPMDCSLPGSSVHGIFQARVLEWVAIAFFGNIQGVSLNPPPTSNHHPCQKTTTTTKLEIGTRITSPVLETAPEAQ